jgi:hypothetical protein
MAAAVSCLAELPFAPASPRVAVVDARGAVLVVGAQLDTRRGWELRALDPRSGRFVWSTFGARRFRFYATPTGICARDGTIYVVHAGSLASLDSTDGRVRWRIRTAGQPASIANRDDCVALYTLATGTVSGVVAFVTEHGHDIQLTAVDRDSGRFLWQRRFSHAAPIVVPDVGVMLDRVLYGAWDGAPLLSLPGHDPSYRACASVDRRIVVTVGGSGAADYDDDGVLVIDTTTLGVLTFRPARGVDLSRGLATFGRVHVVAAEKALVYVGPTEQPPYLLPVQDFEIAQIERAGSMLALDLRASGSMRRILTIDPMSREVCHDTGPFSDRSEPHRDLRVAGNVVAFTVGGRELRAPSGTSGQPLWSRITSDIREWFVLGYDRYVVYGHDRSITVLYSGDGTREGTHRSF